MTSAANNNLPIAIVVGCGLIGLGLYFGLRARPQVVTPPMTPTTIAPGSPNVVAPSTATPPAVPVVDARAFETELARALDEARATFRDKCWTPLVAKTPGPASSTYVFDIEVDAQGNQMARGIQTGEGAREDVANCMRLLIVPIKVPPTGRRMSARVPMKLP